MCNNISSIHLSNEMEIRTTLISFLINPMIFEITCFFHSYLESNFLDSKWNIVFTSIASGRPITVQDYEGKTMFSGTAVVRQSTNMNKTLIESSRHQGPEIASRGLSRFCNLCVRSGNAWSATNASLQSFGYNSSKYKSVSYV